LPNRTLLFDRLSQGIRQMTLEQSPLAVFYLNIDGLKKINEQHGHFSGDCVLQETARRLIAEPRENDTVARFGSDEFVVISRRG
jgi:diguanylate cyclase (GGDEF)-like protein